jgi:hypothetical protein
MESYEISLTEAELQVIRQSLDIVQIVGKDAKFLANLQIKLEQDISKIQQKIVEPKKK